MGALKKVFGGRKSRGTIHEKFAKGSGSIARHALKQLEALKIIEKVPEGKGCAQLHFGLFSLGGAGSDRQ